MNVGNTDHTPACRSMSFLTELATNATRNHVGVVVKFSGNDDPVVAHFGSEGVLDSYDCI